MKQYMKELFQNIAQLPENENVKHNLSWSRLAETISKIYFYPESFCPSDMFYKPVFLNTDARYVYVKRLNVKQVKNNAHHEKRLNNLIELLKFGNDWAKNSAQRDRQDGCKPNTYYTVLIARRRVIIHLLNCVRETHSVDTE